MERFIKKSFRYSEGFKRSVIEEYLRTGATKGYLLKKHGIRMQSGIQTWMRAYGIEDIHRKERYLSLSITAPLTSKKSNSTSKDLETRVKELERLLEDEQLRSEAYKRVIGYAEKELKIPILKKPGSK